MHPCRRRPSVLKTCFFHDINLQKCTFIWKNSRTKLIITSLISNIRHAPPGKNVSLRWHSLQFSVMYRGYGQTMILYNQISQNFPLSLGKIFPGFLLTKDHLSILLYFAFQWCSTSKDTNTWKEVSFRKCTKKFCLSCSFSQYFSLQVKKNFIYVLATGTPSFKWYHCPFPTCCQFRDDGCHPMTHFWSQYSFPSHSFLCIDVLVKNE